MGRNARLYFFFFVGITPSYLINMGGVKIFYDEAAKKRRE